MKGQQVHVLSTAENEKLKSNPKEVLGSPSSLYILDVTPAEASAIQQTYGVMCLSGERPDISPLIDINDIHISGEGEKLGRGWDSVQIGRAHV